MIAASIINVLWIALIVYLVASSFGVKQDTESHAAQSVVLTLVIIVALLLPRLAVFQGLNYAPVAVVLAVIGVALTAGGIAFLVWGRQELGGNWSSTVALKQDQELVTTGPYRYVRNPMYTGTLIACFGSAIVVGGAFIFLFIILGALFLWRVHAEDRLMERQFPDQYPAYRQRTKALVPFVW